MKKNKALEMVRTMINGANEYEKKTGDKNPSVYFSKDNLLIIEQSLQRLDSIENPNPSEALECLKHIKKYYISEPCSAKTYDCLETIKQALLKAQEPKQFLKWEDLEFTKKSKEMLVKLGDTTYTMRYYKVNDNTNKVCISSFQFIEIYDIRFFNDLHLERVEE